MSNIDNLIKIISQDTSALDLDRAPESNTRLYQTKTTGKPKRCFCIQDKVRHNFNSRHELAVHLGVSDSCVGMAISRGMKTAGVIVG